MSYDSVDVLRGFAGKYGITYSLLADEGSVAIRSLGLLNEEVYDQHAAYGIPQQDRHWGVPYPGVFLLDEQGYVVQKRFHQSYRERETGVGILEQGFGGHSTLARPQASAQAADILITASLDSERYRFFQRLWLTVELTIPPGLHLYTQPVPEGYIPLSIEVAPIPGMVVGEPQWPASQPFQVAGLEEPFQVYTGNVKVALPVTLTEEDNDQSLQITVRYQSCSDTDCLMPSTVNLALPVKADDHIERPRRK
jgi:hypothetical protein